MPSKSESQRRAMQAAAHGKSTIGIPKKVGKEFAQADANKTTRQMVKDAKSGKGTLTYEPNAQLPPRKTIRRLPPG